MRQRILLIDDEPAIGLSCRRILVPEGHEVDVQEDARAGLQAALAGQYDVILLDLILPGTHGLEILKQLKAAGVPSEVVVITGYSTVESAVEAMKQGAADYLSKPFSPDQLKIVLQKVAERSALIRENAALRRELEVHQGLEGIIGESRPMQRVFDLVQRVAPTEQTVLILGETGTGKETLGRAIHRLSRRRDRPFLACDCTALIPTVRESELFGHVKGSFSGALATKQGLFEVANRGTVFLEEVADLPLETQGKLLRVLETGQVQRLGESAPREVDVRLIAATSRDLAARVRTGAFREDLYHRLHGAPIPLPPLRDRQGDIPRLAAAFLERFCKKNNLPLKKFSSEAMVQMESYPWPGNVGQLRNVVERTAILCDGERIEPRHLPAEIRLAMPSPSVSQLPRTWAEFKRLKHQVKQTAVRELERRFLIQALERCGGNVSRTAEDLGIQRTNLHTLMRKYGLTSEMLREEPRAGLPEPSDGR
ncbi:MAG: sigma-54-dependent transcriptional regulator [Thermoguttaceae bacterium]